MTFTPHEPPKDTRRVDSDLRLAIANLAGQPRSESSPKKKRAETIPRVAKVYFTIGLSLLGTVIVIPLVGHFLRSSDTPPPAQSAAAAPVSAPQAPKPKAAPQAESSGGGSLGLGAPTSEDGHVEAPMPPSALRVLTGLWTFLNEASHPVPGRPLGRLDPRSDYFPPGTLDAATPDVFEALEVSQLRVARQPGAALRVTACRSTATGFEFDVEFVGAGPSGDEVVSRARIAMVPIDDEVTRLTRMEPLEPFEATGAKLTPQSLEQGTAPAEEAPEPPKDAPKSVLPPVRQIDAHDTPRTVATYPYIIR